MTAYKVKENIQEYKNRTDKSCNLKTEKDNVGVEPGC